ncbi:unnamed protein product [Closterium sp. Naga37s-1]|nr:unnamed protein product [Closterium sp. Naga37s-1]
MSEFWDNVGRFVIYFFTVFTGGLYSLVKPIVDLFKKPTTAVLVVLVLGGGFYVTYLTLLPASLLTLTLPGFTPFPLLPLSIVLSLHPPPPPHHFSLNHAPSSFHSLPYSPFIPPFPLFPFPWPIPFNRSIPSPLPTAHLLLFPPATSRLIAHLPPSILYLSLPSFLLSPLAPSLSLPPSPSSPHSLASTYSPPASLFPCHFSLIRVPSSFRSLPFSPFIPPIPLFLPSRAPSPSLAPSPSSPQSIP